MEQCSNKDQKIDAVSVDLADANSVCPMIT